MLFLLNGICAGKGREGDVDLLLDLCELLEDAALCGLGTTASNPVRSTIDYFREEYDEHILIKHCPAHECRGLFRYEIIAEKCRGCMACLKECPQEAITGERRKPHVIDEAKCVHCGLCFTACQFDSIARV
jgi:NAD-dependent dihydropyrimidine dehydrogenase PreA subunit